ncbi:MAG: hypothetical protein FWC41_13465 [Firmicutes bacterium]|nr:hypothetical protein [Bacillota bacterium]
MTETLKLSKDSSVNELKMYFERVRDLNKSGEEFPVDLDLVWPLVYSTKGNAVRDLKNNFIQDIDYVMLIQNDKQKIHGGAGQNEIDYFLSVSCMEYFIVRKVRPVFEIYRYIFHKTINQISMDDDLEKDRVKASLFFVKWVAKDMNWSDTAILNAYHEVAKEFRLPASTLPVYTQSKGVLRSLSEILEGTGWTAQKANPILEQKDVLIKKSRYSKSKGKDVYFWNISEKYSHLGENHVNKSNPSETQPRWYENKRDEIIQTLNSK